MNSLTFDLDQPGCDDSVRRFFDLTEEEAHSVIGAIATSRCLGSVGAVVELVDSQGRSRELHAARQYDAVYRIEERRERPRETMTGRVLWP